jgi:LysR family transcriptional regulator, transcriptional activator of nhaA
MKLSELNFHHLRLFWEVARSGSLRAAAEKLHLSQPTISAQIKCLEDTLGQQLFQRSGRGLRLNAAGQTVAEYAGEVFSLAGEMVRSLHGQTGGRSLSLRLGIVQSLPKLMAWRLIRPALTAYSNLQLSCTEGQAAELLGILVSGRADAVLSDEPAPASLRVRAFSTRLHDAPGLFCAVPALARRLRRGFPRSLNDAPALLPAERTPWRHRIDRWLEAREIQPRIVAEFDDVALMKTAASDGLGFVPVLQTVKSEAVERYGLKEIGSAPEAGVPCYLITVEKTTRHPALATLVAAARDLAGA